MSLNSSESRWLFTASLLLTVLLAVLVPVAGLSPEWFFGAPFLAALVTIGLLATRGRHSHDASPADETRVDEEAAAAEEGDLRSVFAEIKAQIDQLVPDFAAEPAVSGELSGPTREVGGGELERGTRRATAGQRGPVDPNLLSKSELWLLREVASGTTDPSALVDQSDATPRDLWITLRSLHQKLVAAAAGEDDTPHLRPGRQSR